MTAKNKKIISAILLFSIITTPVSMFYGAQKAIAQVATPCIPVIIPDVTSVPAFDRIATKFLSQIAPATCAANANSVWQVLKTIAKEVLMAAARRVLQEMTKSIVNWINSDFHGSPLFLQNPGSFFIDVEKNEVKTIVSQYGYDRIKFPFGKDFALNAINAYNSKLSNNAAYSLSNAIHDPVLLNNYQNKFYVGGWSGFLINTQYDQNNPLGFTMRAANQLNTGKAVAVSKVQSLLQQGQGFLSPQMCQTNPNYNKLYNEFNAPTFQYNVPFPANYNTDDSGDSVCGLQGCGDQVAYSQAVAKWTADKAAAEAKFYDPHGTTYCPNQTNGSPGLINTTPGAVVADQVMTALRIPVNSTTQAMGLGNDLSVIFDALLNHFINKGLNSLATAINPKAPDDNFTYNGLSLGVSNTTSTNTPSDWGGGPDQPIVLSDLKTTVAASVDNTTKEILAMTNDTPNESGPGSMQWLGKIWPKVQLLDACQPGPNLGWESRVDDEMSRNARGLTNLTDLQFAVNSFKQWLNLQLANALPSSGDNMSAINGLHNLDQQADQLAAKIASMKDTLLSIKSIKTSLDAITTDPAPGSPGEASLVSLWKQYTALKDSLSNEITLGEALTQRDTLKNKSTNLDALLTKCTSERTAKGWSNPGGADSKLNAVAEQEIFCGAPIIGGASHGTFVNEGTPTYPSLPLVNAQNVPTDTATVNISLSCDTIYKATMLDYKGNLPGF